jgi:thioredoxin-related protein
MKKILIIILFLVLLFQGYSISVTPSYNAIDISHALEEASVSFKDHNILIIF